MVVRLMLARLWWYWYWQWDLGTNALQLDATTPERTVKCLTSSAWCFLLSEQNRFLCVFWFVASCKPFITSRLCTCVSSRIWSLVVEIRKGTEDENNKINFTKLIVGQRSLLNENKNHYQLLLFYFKTVNLPNFIFKWNLYMYFKFVQSCPLLDNCYLVCPSHLHRHGLLIVCIEKKYLSASGPGRFPRPFK